MERGYRRARSRRRTHARRSVSPAAADRKTRGRTIRLAACGIIFALAVFAKLLFPGFAADLGEALASTVDYRAALAVLGEGISGDKSFTAALGEAITYAFSGSPTDGADQNGENVSGEDGDGAEEAFGENNDVGEDGADIPAWSYVAPQTESGAPADVTPDTDNPDDAAVVDTDNPNELADAIISAFLQTQEGYSDYLLPAGTTFDMPVIEAAYTAPVTGNVTSGFGYRTHPVDGSVKFHYGIDLAARQGDPILAFSDGDVLAVGESTTLGKYVIVTHNGFETLYAHCDDVYVSSGQAVMLGDIVAAAGDTGNATSYCLHFELKIGGVFVNPGYYLHSV